MKSRYITLLLLLCSVSVSGKDTLTLNINESKDVTPIKYGFHYEEIGMIGDGGLHAELVRNRSFEEGNMAKDMAVVNHCYIGVPRTGEGTRYYTPIDPMIGWSTLPVSYAPIYLSAEKGNPINENNLMSARVVVTEDIVNYPDARIVNEGYYGMNLREGVGCNLSLYLRSTTYKGALEITLTDENGDVISSPVVVRPTKDWSEYKGVLTPNKSVKRGMLSIKPLEQGVFFMDAVSLYPSDTWNGGKSVFRSDVVQALKDYQPSFFSFPGGCIVHGVNEATMYKWKETIGKQSERAGQWSKWGPNYRTDGIGHHEFFELCEYIGADPLYVVSVGMVCSPWLNRLESGLHDHPEVDLDYYIQDAVDAIEYAIGDVDTKWGAERAKNGHPEPFPLKYVKIGNEDFGPIYWERYEIFYNELSRRYPDLIYITNSRLGPDYIDKREDIKEFPDPAKVTIFDEHYYQPVEWMVKQHYRYDKFPRGVADLFIGELGVSGDYAESILMTGASKISMERNGDLNPMFAERPLMRNWDRYMHNKTKRPLYWTGVDCCVKTTDYYLAEMFKENTIDRWYECSLEGDGVKDKLFVSFGFDSASKEYVLKLVNIADTAATVSVDSDFKRVKADKEILTPRTGVNNTPSTPDAIRPQKSRVTIDLSKELQIEASSLVIYRFKR